MCRSHGIGSEVSLEQHLLQSRLLIRIASYSRSESWEHVAGWGSEAIAARISVHGEKLLHLLLLLLLLILLVLQELLHSGGVHASAGIVGVHGDVCFVLE